MDRVVIIALMNRRGELRFRSAGEFRSEAKRGHQKVELGAGSRDFSKFKTSSGLRNQNQFPFASENTNSVHARRLQQASVARNGCWQSHGQTRQPQANPRMHLTGTPNPCHVTIGVPTPLLQHELSRCSIRVRHRSFCLPPPRCIWVSTSLHTGILPSAKVTVPSKDSSGTVGCISAAGQWWAPCSSPFSSRNSGPV